jgi:hypothetical protein
LGREFDGHWLAFLHVKYANLRERVLAGGPDEEILEWCYAKGRRPGEGEVEIFNGFMQKAGWRDASSERLAILLQRSGLRHLDHRCATRFDFIEFDEGRQYLHKFALQRTFQLNLCPYFQVHFHEKGIHGHDCRGQKELAECKVTNPHSALLKPLRG